MSHHLEQRWYVLWKRLRAQGKAKEPLTDLVRRYGEPHRAYHTLEHIQQCFDELNEAKRFAKDPSALELALWYHDAIYDTKANDNEEKSAKLAAEMMKHAGLAGSFILSVANLIRASTHLVIQTDPDIQLFIDIDLSILGQTEDNFDRYEQQIRHEYHWVPASAFVAGRSTVLQSFLERRTIFTTPYFRHKYETQAQRNLERSLSRLRA